jgi:hypothetical protein
MKRLGTTIFEDTGHYYRVCPECGKQLDYKTYNSARLSDVKKCSCRTCARPDTHGNNNPMFGKKHSVTTRNLLSKRSKGHYRSRKRPFEWVYNKLIRDSERRSMICRLSYEEFLEFTKIRFCHYCSDTIEWRPYALHAVNNHGYYLDRKDSSLGYIKDNCVVCCSDCNWIKGDRISYEEMLLIGAARKEFRSWVLAQPLYCLFPLLDLHYSASTLPTICSISVADGQKHCPCNAKTS